MCRCDQRRQGVQREGFDGLFGAHGPPEKRIKRTINGKPQVAACLQGLAAEAGAIRAEVAEAVGGAARADVVLLQGQGKEAVQGKILYIRFGIAK